jgi:hypothetical protein
MKFKKIMIYFTFASLVFVGCDSGSDTSSGPVDPVYNTGTTIFGDSTGEDVIYGLEKIAGGFLLVGNTASLNNGSSSDGLVMQVDGSGTVIWEATMDGGNNDYDRLYDIEVDSNGVIVVAGFATIAAGDTDMWIATLTSAGTLQNMNLFGDAGARERAYTVGDWSNYDLYMMGGYNSSTTATLQYANRADLSISNTVLLNNTSTWYRGIKTSDNLIVHVGDMLVDGQYDGIFTAIDANDASYVDTPGKVISTIASRLYGVNKTPSNGLVICGLADSGNGYIAKATNSGEIVWEVTTTQPAVLMDILEDSMGNVVAAGFSGADAFMVKLDALGNILASKTFDGSGGSDRFFGIAESDNGEFVMVGNTENSSGDKDGWMVITDPNGN